MHAFDAEFSRAVTLTTTVTSIETTLNPLQIRTEYQKSITLLILFCSTTTTIQQKTKDINPSAENKNITTTINTNTFKNHN